ncbi:hypothetical protein [Yersinia phage fPS-59]|uniref:HNS binding protein n=1 Tax=Yersinia phage fPS-59 TaxID=2052754 RepID=A0A2D0PEA3_9CAUD|nr:Gp5.5-like host HNS inhibition [Yersinia phage fPS-59]SOO46810.1 hypothetical protein [Yersinia phage fPS-59]
MSITKRYKVTFEFTHVIDSEGLTQLDKRVLEAAQVVTGKLTVQDSPFNSYGFAKGLVLAALNGGQEAAAAFLVKSGMREVLRDELTSEDGFKFAPAYVREVR